MDLRLGYYILVFLFSTTNLYSQEISVIDSSSAIQNKEALVILNGFGNSKKNRKIQKEFFENKGYDLFIPIYVDRKSVDSSIINFSSFYYSNNLDSYKYVHFICYIVGGLVLNSHINQYGKGKIKTIIYDRSPTQERAAKVATKKLPIISRILYGCVLKDFSKRDLKSLSNVSNLHIGVIIENKATRLMRNFKRSANKYGEYNYTALDIEPNANDFIHTFLDHNQMYTRFDVIGGEIFNFLEDGKFSENAKREKYDWDPFKKLKKNDIYL